MKTNKKLALSIASFAAAMVCMVGGTYAWYVVSNTATASMSGKTIEATDGLVLGVANTTGTFATDGDATWNGTFAETTKKPLGLDDVIKNNGYATAGFTPVTSGSFDGTTNIALKDAPTTSVAFNETTADKAEYAKFTLVFKTIKADTEIYLNIPQFTFNDSGDTGTSVLHALRVGFESDLEKSILAPYYLNDDPATVTEVGGVMDLNTDGVYDYTFDLNAAEGERYKEIYYGEADGEVVYRDLDTATDEVQVPDVHSNPYFLAGKHLGFANDQYKENVKVVDVANTKAKTQTAHALSYYAFDSSTDGQNHPITKTSTKIGEYYYGTVDVTMWVEGWDEACRQDYIAGKDFGFTFGFTAPTLID